MQQAIKYSHENDLTKFTDIAKLISLVTSGHNFYKDLNFEIKEEQNSDFNSI